MSYETAVETKMSSDEVTELPEERISLSEINPLDQTLFKLTANTDALVSIIGQLTDLQRSGNFKYASKIARNALLHGLLDQVDEVSGAAKEAVQQLKKVKRERVPDQVVDVLLNAINPFCHLPVDEAD
jgi:hypothetical protein